MKRLQAAEAKLLLPTYERNPILFVGGEGVYLIDESGDEYLDLLSGIGVNALGYGHPAMTEGDRAAEPQADSHLEPLLPRGAGGAGDATDGDERAGSRLLLQQRHRSVGSSAEAGARLCGPAAQRRPAIGTKFLALEHSFHGRTMGSVSTTHKEKYREPFAPVMPGVEFVRFNDVDDLRAKFSSEVCAILIEAIQGEGGIRPVSQEFFAAARELAQSTGALLIADEIQSGLGRTGKWFAYQHLRHSAGHHHAGQAARRRSAAGRDALHGRSGARDPSLACTAPPSAAARWPARWPSR